MEIPATKNHAFSFKHGCMLLCFATLWSPYVSLHDCEFPAIFNFGDSNSDTGAMSAAYYPVTSPYGETYFGKPSGRFSDGRIIIDFLATDLRLPFLHAYLDSLGADYNFKQGANFAVGGSTIKPLGRILEDYFKLSPLYLDIELTQFSEFMPRSQTIRKQGGMFAELMPSNDSFSRALYTIDMSQNDFGIGFYDTTIEEVNATVPNLAKLISKHVQGLYNLGGRSFWIHNAAPIGCLAYILSHAKLKRHQIDGAGCGIAYNDVVQYYNQKLKEEVFALREALPDAFITYVDIYSIKYSFFRWPRKYGFKSPLSVCCGSGGGTYNFNSSKPCGLSPSCSDPSVKVVWDGGHYTEAANKLVFDMLNTGEFSDPPVPPRFACQLNAQ